MVSIKINTNNAAFHDESGVLNIEHRNYEIARILRSLSDKLEMNASIDWNSVMLMDSNGNSVGSFIYDPEDK